MTQISSFRSHKGKGSVWCICSTINPYQVVNFEFIVYEFLKDIRCRFGRNPVSAFSVSAVASSGQTNFLV